MIPAITPWTAEYTLLPTTGTTRAVQIFKSVNLLKRLTFSFQPRFNLNLRVINNNFKPHIFSYLTLARRHKGSFISDLYSCGNGYCVTYDKVKTCCSLLVLVLVIEHILLGVFSLRDELNDESVYVFVFVC